MCPNKSLLRLESIMFTTCLPQPLSTFIHHKWPRQAARQTRDVLSLSFDMKTGGKARPQKGLSIDLKVVGRVSQVTCLYFWDPPLFLVLTPLFPLIQPRSSSISEVKSPEDDALSIHSTWPVVVTLLIQLILRLPLLAPHLRHEWPARLVVLVSSGISCWCFGWVASGIWYEMCEKMHPETANESNYFD